MTIEGVFIQVLNGIQYGLLLFLISSGLTLVFGVLGIINLAHGSLFMVGAYVTYLVARAGAGLWLSIPLAIVGGAILGLLLERFLFRRFYHREHLDQVLLTFALILLFEEARALIAGNDFHSVAIPPILDISVPIAAGFSYSAYRLAVLLACLAIAAAMFWTIERTRAGAAIRAAAEKPEMVDLLGLDARRVHALVFAAGTALAMLGGALAAPLYSVYPNMGDGFLIVSFVVVVVGGLGSVAGAFWAALLIGLVDTMAKVFVPTGAGAAIYAIMAVVLICRPNGLFAART